MSLRGGTSQRVVAVIVAYKPDEARFAEVLAAVANQVDSIIVVDNAHGSGLSGVVWSDNLRLLEMSHNVGVAAALNAGIDAAFSGGAAFALLLDHDSVASDGMVDSLRLSLMDLEARGERVASVGANYRDSRRPNISPFVRLTGLRLLRPSSQEPVPWVSYLISSGSLISRAAFESIGRMDDRLFVDYVDIEWGLRASQLGWKSFGVSMAKLDHRLGDDQLRIFGTDYPTRSPLRHYYMTRNASWLILRGAMPLNWKLVEGARLLRRSIAYAFYAPRGDLHIRAMLSGFRDGMKGRLGAKEAAS